MLVDRNGFCALQRSSLVFLAPLLRSKCSYRIYALDTARLAAVEIASVLQPLARH